MANLNVQMNLIKKDDGNYSVIFMEEEVISFCEAVYKTDGDKIYDALVSMFIKGVEMAGGRQP